MLHVDIPLFGKSLDYDITKRYEQVGLIEGAVLKLSSVLFSPGNRIDRGLQLGYFQDCEITKYIDLINAALRNRPMRRYFDADSLAWHLNFSKGNFQTICFTLIRDERIAGIVYGFKNRVGDHFVAFLDGLILDPNLNYSQKRRFMGSVEERLRDDDCFAVTGVRTVFSENPLKYGYVPFSKQTMEIAVNDDRSCVSKHEVLNSFFELR